MSSAGTEVSIMLAMEDTEKESCLVARMGKPVLNAASHSFQMAGLGKISPVRTTPANGVPFNAAMHDATSTSSRSPGVNISVFGWLSLWAMFFNVIATTQICDTRRLLMSPLLSTSAPRCSWMSTVRGFMRSCRNGMAPNSRNLELKNGHSFWMRSGVQKMAGTSIWQVPLPPIEALSTRDGRNRRAQNGEDFPFRSSSSSGFLSPFRMHPMTRGSSMPP
mmetsp:Transcript_11583/g.33338  ORF Transcript_11583/g.33338 Transcript_11583/m.33338 type:complete len:220 (+) Transcript_11583:1430-2089(+)